MIRKIISGGQTGADQAGISAALTLGIDTGGTMPKGFKTEAGNRPDLGTYGLVEHSSTKYPPRTACNVRDSDGTLIFGDLGSSGSQLTLKLCKQYNKPYFSLAWTTGDKILAHKEFKDWLQEHKIEILNVAGNRKSSSPHIFKACREFLIGALDERTR